MNSTVDNAVSLTTNKPHLVSEQLLVATHAVNHNPKSGLNPVADAASHLFTILGNLKQLPSYPELDNLQIELSREISSFFETVKNHGYSLEYTIVCRYVLCATLDEIISHSQFANEAQWRPYSLLAYFNQDLQHQEKFFTILERIIKEPALYIDLMELMYLSLSFEYKGRYRSTRNGQSQLEQIINSLYKHIRAYRGSFSKILSPTPLKSPKSILESRARHKRSLRSIFIVTLCAILTILIGLDYLMDVISNEPDKIVTQSGNNA